MSVKIRNPVLCSFGNIRSRGECQALRWCACRNVDAARNCSIIGKRHVAYGNGEGGNGRCIITCLLNTWGNDGENDESDDALGGTNKSHCALSMTNRESKTEENISKRRASLTMSTLTSYWAQ